MKRLVCFIIVMLCLMACSHRVVQPKVYGRYVAERKDDFAWENEYAAFRMYGPALRPENPSNGVDLWLKNSPALAVDTMYARELKHHRPYHINYDGNLDCYKVGHTCGAGGLVIIANDSTYVGGAYDRWTIVEQTPKRLVFRLEYDSLLVAGQWFKETITVTAQAGQMMNKAEVVLNAYESSAKKTQMLVGGGIYMHDTIDQVAYIGRDAIRYSEDALSDKQAARMNYEYNGSTTQGRVAITVRTPGATLVGLKDGNAVALRPYVPGERLVYYFGATWSEWKKNNK